MYEAFYRLARRPFSLTPDRRFLFPSQGHKRALSYLLYGLEQREGFVVITGDIGIGKTLLIQTLFAELALKKMATARLAAANLTADGVLPMVAAAFGRPYEGLSKVSLLRDLESTLLRDPEYREGALLVVDEAQTFSAEALEELRILSNFEINGRALMQIFLVGQTELRYTLGERRMAQLRQRVIASHHLDPLDRDETEAYVRHRLTSADWSGDPDLVPEVYDKVHRWSGGIPRRINLLMDRVLLFGYLEELHRLDAANVEAVIDELRMEACPVDEVPEASAETTLGGTERGDLEERLSALEAGFRLLLRHSAASRLRALPEVVALSDSEGGGEIEPRIAALEAALDSALGDTVFREIDSLDYDQGSYSYRPAGRSVRAASRTGSGARRPREGDHES
ncbi:MAG TPA: AAA family ATPase [Acidobacteriaceae bacterium]|nr:AAA family ATPase [Acidobacteriaceae bacterium]